MSNRLPLDGSANFADFMLVSYMAINQGGGNPLAAAMLGQSISPGKAYIVPGPLGYFTADVVLDLDAGFNLVSITGTEDWIQLFAEIAGSPLVSFDGVPGRVSGFFALNAALVQKGIFSVIDRNKPTVFIGHSLGGAVAEILASYAIHSLGLTVQCVYTIGAPKPGDAAFAASLPFNVYRLENQLDPVPSIPQFLQLPAALSALMPIPADWGQYAQVGLAITQDGAGQWTIGHSEMSATDIVATLVAGTISQHFAETYYQYLRPAFLKRQNLVPFANGFEKPWLLAGLMEQPAPPNSQPGPGISVPPSFTNQFTVYQLTKSGVIALGTMPDPPPQSWTPDLVGIPNKKGGCVC